MLALLFIGAIGLGVARHTATREAIRDARTVVDTEARFVAPAVTAGVFDSDPSAIGRLDRLVRGQVLSGRLVRVKVWDAAGRIRYSDDASLIGRRFGLDPEERAAITHRTVDAELSDLSRPENLGDRALASKLLEVYVGTRAADGTPILVEGYLRYDSINDNSSRILRSFLPVLLLGILGLALIQIPLAAHLARRVERSEREQRRLLEQAVDASTRERSRIAADLHDSVVQGLAGTSYSVAAVADDLARQGDTERAGRLREQSAELRQWVRELRTLIVNMAPPKLHEQGLAAAIGDLASSLQARGITTDVAVDAGARFDPGTEALVFRCAQESVRNVLAHADAGHVALSVEDRNGSGVRLVVTDDGHGFDDATIEWRRQQGHVGLDLLRDLVDGNGGSLRVDAVPGAGTTVTLETKQ